MRQIVTIAATAILAVGVLVAPAAADNGVDDHARTAGEAAQMAADFATDHQGCLGPLRSAIARGELAAALGAELGPVISINTNSNLPRPPVPMGAGIRAMAAESDASESYNAADLSFNAVVTVVFELKD